jgi:hypothetical protein
MNNHDINLVGVRQSISKFGIDIARSYCFSLSMPSIIDANDSKSITTILCVSTRVPDFTLKSKSIKISTLDISLVEGIDFKPWNVTLLSDCKEIVRSNLLTWTNVAYDFNRKGASSPSSYKKKIIVKQLDIYGKDLSTYTMFGAYPEHVEGYELSNTEANFSKFNVLFKYDYFIYEKTSSLKETAAFEDQILAESGGLAPGSEQQRKMGVRQPFSGGTAQA